MSQAVIWVKAPMTFLILSGLLSIIFALVAGSLDSGHLAKREKDTTAHDSLVDLSHNVTHLWSRSDLDSSSCTKDIPCHTNACCGSFFGGKIGTCGFGDTFCGSDCASQCDAKAECGANADPPGKTCPLNVCCSKYGFCGTTDEFCSPEEGCQNNCGYPDVPAGKSSEPVLSKVVGYYEAWMERKECHKFPPSAIPVDGLTHVNFAFAFIDPDTFEITTMDSETPADLFAQTADVRTLKSGNSDLEVFVSLGGWTFSDNNTATQPVFGNIASTEANRQKFADNLVDFMKHYGFDGVDFDWEYPGAGDRGGKKEDTQNFVKLMRTLRNTFDNSERGTYGLTFTIPSTYWYLQWFDVPSMLEYADWVNLMSYDLHGVWDQDNPIGSIVLAHTNLTEIKQSAELLWRNDIPPGKVVLGLGFYGRAFQLKDRSCTHPGCPFAGAAEKGSCTDNAGTLAYFEIQDILAAEKPKVVHDKEAAVNYMIFKGDQWVSFDDKETFKQKVDWANDVGLGGVMIWSVDQDDDQFSALEGLLGHGVGDYKSMIARSAISDAEHWASSNGQKCIETNCSLVPSCPAGYELAPFTGVKAFKDNCKGQNSRAICCPIDAMPQSCVWRGGESSRSCHGQCHEGEMTLFHSRHATTNCYRPGFQAACCEASSYGKLLEACHIGSNIFGVGKGKQECETGQTKIAEIYQPTILGSGIYRPICCPSESAFENCHWVGKGTCDDNECSDTDVEFMLDKYGDTTSQCAAGLNGRQKVLCCNAPKSINPFLPVDLDKVFPTLPPKSDYPDFDLQNLGADSTPVVNEPNQQTFGMVIIDGPPEAVTKLRRRDNMGFEVLDCDAISETGHSTVRVVCSGREATDCQIGNGVVNGTILHMPDGCGPGAYVVSHSLRVSDNQQLPSHVKRSMGESIVVHDLEVSYDFTHVKRDSGDIYIRIDYSNTPDFWNDIVQADPVKKRGLESRFWSENEDVWKSKFDTLRNDDHHQGVSSLRRDKFNNLLIASKGPDSCPSPSFLEVDIGGDIQEDIRFGFSFVGTISPTFQLEEAHGFFDTRILYDGFVKVNARGTLNIDNSLDEKDLWTSPISSFGFSHPGICSFRPELNIGARLAGTGHEIDADFTANFIAGNDLTQSTRLNQPLKLGSPTGRVTDIVPNDAFEGNVVTDSMSSSSLSTRKRATDDTVLAIGLNLKASMKLDFFGWKSTLLNAQASLEEYVNSDIRIKNDGSVVFSNSHAGYQVDLTGDLPGWEEISATHVGQVGHVNVLHPAGGDAPSDTRETPDPPAVPLFDDSFAVTCSGGNSSLRCLSGPELARVDPELLIDPDTGGPYSDQYGQTYVTRRDLEERARGGRRAFAVNQPNGPRFTIRSLAYFFGDNGEALLAVNPSAGLHAAEDPYDCNNLGTTDDATDPTLVFVTEHGMELQYFPRMLEFLMTGTNIDPDGTTYTAGWASTSPTDGIWFDENSPFQQNYSTWDPTGTRTGRPIDRVWEAFGSVTNPQRNVNTEQALNGYKERVWLPDSVDRADEALSVINQAFYSFQYLNENIREIVADSLNVIRDEMTHYAARVNHNFPGADLPDLGERHLQFFYRVVIPRMERVEPWVKRRLDEMERVWTEARDNGHPDAEDILVAIARNQEQLKKDDAFLVDTTGFPSEDEMDLDDD
ncbi:hypothetical protein AARAC_011883 [Aspergillus arachidicola]|uniref:chitinase n=1 Tax=Aspergillus arachidicola TaxID=656916 RepID=A0A2G7G5F1_9EURO|nr:hypothetical protein AARAC_011883 [Aspergillus arachidicola]